VDQLLCLGGFRGPLSGEMMKANRKVTVIDLLVFVHMMACSGAICCQFPA
jgi:hypothetical protein